MPNYQALMENLKKRGYEVSFFPTAEDAAEYLDREIDGKSVGSGGSMTLKEMGLLELLGKHLGVFATGGGAAAQEGNNIFEVIDQSTREEIDTNGISEIEPPAEPGDDVVE